MKEERDRRAANQETDLQKEKEHKVNNICLGKIEKKIKDRGSKIELKEAAAPEKAAQPTDEVLKG